MFSVLLQAQVSHQVFLSSLHQLVENMKVSLTMVLVNHSRLFQQIAEDVATNSISLRIKTSVNLF